MDSDRNTNDTHDHHDSFSEEESQIRLVEDGSSEDNEVSTNAPFRRLFSMFHRDEIGSFDDIGRVVFGMPSQLGSHERLKCPYCNAKHISMRQHKKKHRQERVSHNSLLVHIEANCPILNLF